MVTVQLAGGIGNQLCQVAAAYALAINNKDGLILSSHGWAALQGENPEKYKHTFFKNFMWTDEPLNYPVIQEPGVYHQLNYTGNIKLKGYFQDSRYFNMYRSLLYKTFFSSVDTLPYFDKKVSLHVRRGDYMRLYDKHPPVTLDYIYKAIEAVEQSMDIESILLFSDDTTWCKENIKDDRLVVADIGDDQKNIYLMTRCGVNIISNSTYSWWGAYLNPSDEKIVIAPETWYGNKDTQLTKAFSNAGLF